MTIAKNLVRSLGPKVTEVGEKLMEALSPALSAKVIYTSENGELVVEIATAGEVVPLTAADPKVSQVKVYLLATAATTSTRVLTG